MTTTHDVEEARRRIHNAKSKVYNNTLTHMAGSTMILSSSLRCRHVTGRTATRLVPFAPCLQGRQGSASAVHLGRRPLVLSNCKTFARQGFIIRLATARTTTTTTTFTAKRTSTTAASKLDDDTTRGFVAWWVPLVGGLIVTCAGGLSYFYHQVGSLEGLQRTAYFYSFAIPKYIEYRYHLWRQSEDQVWDALHYDTATRALQYVLQLQGFYIKCGQMCAANIGNAFPRIWQDTMSVLQDNCPAQSMETVEDIIAKDYQQEHKPPPRLIFASMETTPIGAASIGQVHRAVLNDDKATPVVVKICYPAVERLLKGDVRTIKLFAQLAQPVHVPALEEVEVQFATEFDYRREGRNMQEIRQNMVRAGLAAGNDNNHNHKTALCQIPQPLLEHCTKHVLVMTELKGIKLVDALRADVEQQAARAGVSPDALVLQRRHTTLAQFQRDAATPKAATHNGVDDDEIVHHGPTARQYQQWIALADSQRRLANLRALLYNLTMGWLSRKPVAYQDKSVLPLNHAQMVDDLLYIHGHEVLVDGLFNGDPHPGNILLCRRPDGSAQLGLIDYGQVKRLTKAHRHLFCRLVLALAADNKDEIIALTKEAGFESKYMDPDVIYSYAKVAYDVDSAKYTGGMHIQMFMEDLQARDPIAALPYDFIVVSRCTLLLRGLAHALQQPRSIAQAWRPIAERVLREDL